MLPLQYSPTGLLNVDNGAQKIYVEYSPILFGVANWEGEDLETFEGQGLSTEIKISICWVLILLNVIGWE